MPARFLFVNKDAGSASLTRGNASEQSSINSHVQRGRRHKRSAPSSGRSAHQSRRHLAQRKSRSSDASADDRQDPQGHEDALDPRDQQDSPPDEGDDSIDERDAASQVASSPQFVLPSRPLSPHAVLQPTASSKPSRPSRPSPRTPRRRKVDGKPTPPAAHGTTADGLTIVLLNPSNFAASPQDISQVSSNYLDPFAQSVVKVDPHIAELCRYFCDTFHPSVWHAESWTLGSYTYQQSAPAVIRRAMQNEVEMNAILACMASRIENVDRVAGQGTDKYMGNALKAVRKRFHSYIASRHQLLLIIFHLYAGEAYRQNYQAAKIHMRAAKALFASWGGLDNVPDPCVKELFIIGDGHMSAVLLEPCDLPCEYDPGPYWAVTAPDHRLDREPDLSHIAPALQAAGAEGDLPDDLVRAILDAAECTWVLQNAAHGSAAATKHAGRWLQWRNAAVRHRLLALEYADASLDVLRVALLMWILNAMVLLGLKSLCGLMAPKLQTRLTRSSRPYRDWVGRVDVKMWVLSVGAICAVPNSDAEKWFVDQLFDLGLAEHLRRVQERSPYVATEDALRSFEEKFFYYDPIQRPRLRRLAQLLTDSLSSRSSSAAISTPPDPLRKSRSPP